MYLWFFLIVPVIMLIHFVSLRKIKRKAMLFANYEALERIFGKKILSKNYPLLILRVLTLIFLVFALTGTVLIYEGAGGVADYALAIDASASMLAQDYPPSRVEAAKDAALSFVDTLPADTRVGVISFAGASFVRQELTYDMDDVKAAVSGVDIELAGGTAIGEAIVSSANMLVASDREKVIVLLTDGQNNVGIGVEEALDYASGFGIVIHTIGIGTEEGAVVANTTFVSGLDSGTLQLIAERTGGRFYLAETEEELLRAYEDIAVSTTRQLSLDLSSYLMLIAVALFLTELVLVNSKYRTIP
ncbi:MAG: VWA domain-containing protein [Candidatus Aenigmarchaeota archaeon]|nr:VWA domain-containing protein [Candidatus Aenigmarchaeota archaeon]